MKGLGQTLLAVAAVLMYLPALLSIMTAIGSWRGEQLAKQRRLGRASSADLKQDAERRLLLRVWRPVLFVSGAMALAGGVLMWLAE